MVMRELLAFTFGATVIALVACVRTADATTAGTLLGITLGVGALWFTWNRDWDD